MLISSRHYAMDNEMHDQESRIYAHKYCRYLSTLWIYFHIKSKCRRHISGARERAIKSAIRIRCVAGYGFLQLCECFAFYSRARAYFPGTKAYPVCAFTHHATSEHPSASLSLSVCL